MKKSIICILLISILLFVFGCMEDTSDESIYKDESVSSSFTSEESLEDSNTVSKEESSVKEESGENESDWSQWVPIG